LPVVQPGNALATHKGPRDLHDFHQPSPPLGAGTAGAGAEAGATDGVKESAAALAASGSQWSMMPTMVRSLG
jgi:hypothetical protein